jgi:hypothetical protein
VSLRSVKADKVGQHATRSRHEREHMTGLDQVL